MPVFARATAEATMASPSAEYLAENNAPRILSIVGVFGFLALVSVTLRLYVRGAMLRYIGADDIVMAMSMVSKPLDRCVRECAWTNTIF